MGKLDKRDNKQVSPDTQDGHNEPSVVIDDTNIVAYLNYRGFRFSPFRKGVGDRIGFHIFGDIDDALGEFYAGETMVNVQDFISCLKKVRGSMFLLKGMDE